MTYVTCGTLFGVITIANQLLLKETMHVSSYAKRILPTPTPAAVTSPTAATSVVVNKTTPIASIPTDNSATIVASSNTNPVPAAATTTIPPVITSTAATIPITTTATTITDPKILSGTTGVATDHKSSTKSASPQKSSHGLLQSFRAAFKEWQVLSHDTRLMNMSILNTFYWASLAGVQMTVLPLYMVSPLFDLGPAQIGTAYVTT